MVIGILVLSGLGASGSTEEKVDKKEVAISFSQPILDDEGQYITVNLDEANSYLMRQGKPMLPMYSHEFTFSFGTKIIDVICSANNIQEKTIDKEIKTTPIATVVSTAVTNNDEKTELTEPYPENWYEYDVSSGLKGSEHVVFVNVRVYPLKYNPIKSTIEWMQNVDITVEYETPSESQTFEDQYTYIILTADEFSDELSSLVSHKNSRGVTTKLVTLSEIYDGTYFTAQGRDNPEIIKYFIKNAIENWGTSYVMLVGSWYDSQTSYQKFPVRKTHVYMNDADNDQFVSDLYYADIYDGEGLFSSWDSNENDIFGQFYENNPSNSDDVDLHPDVYLGRIPCTDGEQLTTYVNKVITYENNEAYTKDWFTDLTVVGGDSFIDDDHDPDGYYEGELVNEVVIDLMDGFIPTKIQVSNGKLTLKNHLHSAINDGAGFIDFSGHGNTNIWATHPHLNDKVWLPAGGYFNSDIENRNNGNELPIIITGACSVSKFNKDKNCFSWSWLHNENGGGIASYGATALGYAYIADYVTQGLIEKISIETFASYKDGAITTGEMWGGSINSYMVNPGVESDADWKAVEEWSLFGDPTLAVADESTAPVRPAAPEGPTSGGVNTPHTYTASTTDVDGDEIYYLFDWGDGTFSGWVGPEDSGDAASATHTWSAEGDYAIKVKAKDEHGVQSEWSPELPISMPRSRTTPNSLFMQLLERFSNIFPILKTLLN